MLTIVKAVKTALQGSLTLDYVRDSDIFASPHVNFVPSWVKEYFIGLKDGKVYRKEQSCGVIEKTGELHLAMFVRMADVEKSIVGEVSSSTKGVLEMAADVVGILQNNLLSITGLQAALVTGEPPSEYFNNTDKGVSYQRKIITITYVWEE